MGEGDLPMQNAEIPNEEACQPELQNMPPRRSVKIRDSRGLKVLTESTQSTEISSSQNSSKSYKEKLSQPPAAFSHRQRLQWLQSRRETGLWGQCDDCSQWRYLPHVLDRHELPLKWYCSLNPDKSYANCSVPESPLRIREEEDLIHSEYSAGSVVWVQLPGWPWWPAMVDDDTDTEQFYWIDGFSDIPTHYNVVFFDASDVTRSWVAPKNMKPFGPNKKSFGHVVKDKRYKKRLEVAVAQANDAETLPLHNRLAKYSFIARYPGTVNTPKKISKHDLERRKAQLIRKYNIAFPDESGAESDEESKIVQRKQKVRNVKKNIVLVGTPKKDKRTKVSEKDKKERVSSSKEAITDDKNTSNKPVNEIELEDKKCEPSIESESNEVFKQPNSMLVQAGSTQPSALVEGSFDNDSSKTYLPECESETESTHTIQETVNSIQKRMVSPSSDDFDY